MLMLCFSLSFCMSCMGSLDFLRHKSHKDKISVLSIQPSSRMKGSNNASEIHYYVNLFLTFGKIVFSALKLLFLNSFFPSNVCRCASLFCHKLSFVVNLLTFFFLAKHFLFEIHLLTCHTLPAGH